MEEMEEIQVNYTLDECQVLTSKWHRDRQITINGNVMTQTLKLAEEFGEVSAAVVRNKNQDFKDGIGDMLVVMNSMCELQGTSLRECWNHAYNEIKDRTGTLLPNGNFVKDA